MATDHLQEVLTKKMAERLRAGVLGLMSPTRISSCFGYASCGLARMRFVLARGWYIPGLAYSPDFREEFGIRECPNIVTKWP